MRTFPGIKLDAFKEPNERAQLKIISDMLRQVSAGLSRSIEVGTLPGPNVSSTVLGGGAPPTAKYIIQKENAALSQAQSLGDLATGILLNTTTGITGVLSIAGATDLPDHDHSVNEGGNIPEGNISGIGILARLNQDDQVITATWDFGPGTVAGSGAARHIDFLQAHATSPALNFKTASAFTHSLFMATDTSAADVWNWYLEEPTGGSADFYYPAGGGTLSVEGHTHTKADITDLARTRKIFYPVTLWQDALATGASQWGGSAPDVFLKQDCIGNDTTTTLATQIVLPVDFTPVVTWKLLWANKGTSTNNTVWGFTFLQVADGADLAAGGTDVTVTDAPPAVANQLKYTQLSTSASGLSAGSLVRLSVQRLSGHASDTNTGTMSFLGVQLEYTADI